jgi:outer membrane protein OmpA-like peptidoglycan-associated protein
MTIAALTAAPQALAADAAGCKDPAWAPQRFANYMIDSCTTRAWAALEVETTGGSKTIYGKRVTVSYQLPDGSKDHTADEVRNYFAAAAMKAGAKPMTDPKSGYNVTLEKKTPQGDEWQVYEHGSGNETSTSSFTLTTLDVMPLPQEMQAKAMTAPLDVKSKKCANPPWLVKNMAGFKPTDCEGKAFDSVDVDLANGAKTIQGQRLTVTFSTADDKTAPTAVAAEMNTVHALQAIGAKLMSKPDDINNAVLTQTTPVGEIWYVYSHGSGNDDETDSYSVATIVTAGFNQEVIAQPMTQPMSAVSKACANPPWLKKQFDYFKLSDCTYSDLNSVTLDLPSGPKTLAGRIMEVNYALTDETRDPTALAVKKNYVNALEKIGAKLVSDANDVYNAVLTQKTPVGDMWYVYRHGSGNETSTESYTLLSVEVGGPPPRTCTLEVYGVNFDFNKSTLKPDSEPVLQQVLTLFKSDPSYSGEIGGHTDNVGKEEYNMKLSQARADAVKAWLVAHGVDAKRITAKGYGDTRPLVPNTTDANRFKNRRVELKRNNCKG